ncbi:MAG: nucleoside hydrolase [Planctomycetaceae bacterium]|nr:nucleoside hydrolase [Planctomycetaceae bacterium]
MPRPRKLILDIDPGVSDALAACVALNMPEVEVVAVTATGGNVSPRQASLNVQAIVEHLDPPRLPRIGVAEEDQPLTTDNRALWGADGFCGAKLKVAELHQQHPSIKLLSDEIRAAPGDVTVIAGGPLTNIAAAFQMEPDLPLQIRHLIIVGGTFEGPGDVTPAAEFNIYCNPEAAQRVFRSPATKTLLPLDVTSQATLTFDLLNKLPPETNPTGHFLRAVLPPAFQAMRQKLGLEGLYAPEALAVAAALHPELLTTEQFHCDVETEGRLTHGATVIDRRRRPDSQPNADVAVGIDVPAALDCVLRGLRDRG